METNSITKNKPSEGNFSEVNSVNTDRLLHQIASAPQSTPPMVDALFSTGDYYTDKNTTCVTAEAKSSPDCRFKVVQWRSESTFVSTALFARRQALPLDARIVSRDLALAENDEANSVAVCRRNGTSVTSQVISTILEEKWDWHASETGGTLCAVNDVSEFYEMLRSSEKSDKQSAARNNIEVWDLLEEKLVPSKLLTVDSGDNDNDDNDDDDFFESTRMSMSRDGSMLLSSVYCGPEDVLAVWTKQEVQEGNNFVFQSDTRFDHGDAFETMNCGGHPPRECKPKISKLACSEDKNKVAIGWYCYLSDNLFVMLITQPTDRHSGLVTVDLQSKGSFEHILFSQSGTWLAFFCKSDEHFEECENSATLLRSDGVAAEQPYNILGEGGFDNPCFSSDSSLFAYTTHGQTKVINLANLSQVSLVSDSNTLTLDGKSVTSLDFSPRCEKNTLIVVSESKINFWEFKPQLTCVAVLNLAPHTLLFKQAVFSSDGLSIMALDQAEKNIYLVTPGNVEETDGLSKK